MRVSADNPIQNQLPQGIEEAELLKAIESSGYPLQGIIANKLKDNFTVIEEWGYIDRDTQEHRSLDVFAYKALVEDPKLLVQPRLVLLIECKRSHHPYIFFQNIANRPIPRFPSIAGLKNGDVQIYARSGKSNRAVSGAACLGLDKHLFIEAGPPKCSAFSRAVANGKKVDLSGAEPFNSIVLPLVKALDHANQIYKAQGGPEKLFPTLIFCISVLDAPMILVESPEQASNPIFTPWVRVIRQEANPDSRSWERFRFYAVDAIHVNFFDDFLHNNFLPFVNEFKQRTIQLGEILLNGGEVPNLDKWEWNQIQKLTKKL